MSSVYSDKERLFCCQAGRGVLFNQRQSAEAKLVNGLVGIQRWEICVNLTIVLSNMEAVGTDVVAKGNPATFVTVNFESRAILLKNLPRVSGLL